MCSRPLIGRRRSGELLVALQAQSGGVSRSVGHALLAVDEDAVLLDGDFLLQTHAVVLKVFQRVLRIVQLLHERVDGTRDLVHLGHEAATRQTRLCG